MALDSHKDIGLLFRALRHSDLTRLMVDSEERLKWISIWKRILGHLKGNSFQANDEAICLIRGISHEHMTLTQSIIRIETFAKEEEEQIAKVLSNIKINSEEESSRTRKRHNTDHGDQLPDISLKAENVGEQPEETDEHLRHWYVSNLDHPFPDRDEKQHLSTLTDYAVGQLNTWFTNMRRRSGYTEYLRSLAGGDKRQFQKMIRSCEEGKGHEEIKEALEDMKKYVAKRPRGKVGEWLMNLIEEKQTAETNPRKKRRVDKETSDELERVKPEQTLAPPDPFRAPTPEAPSTPIAKAKTLAKKAGTPKKIKTYTFSVGASGDPGARPSAPRKLRPISSPLRTSPLRTVSTNSTSSLETVDSALRSVSASSTTRSSSSNISSDLNFSFPAYNVNVPPPPAPPTVKLPTVILTPPAPSFAHLPSVATLQYPSQQTLYTFGATENSQFVFNPSLPHTVQVAPYYHQTMPYSSYHPQIVYPSSQPPAPTLQNLQHYMPYPTSDVRFAHGFGEIKRGIAEVGGAVGDERAHKLSRFEEV